MYKTFNRGLLGSNTYVVYDSASREAMIIDCGNMPGEIVDFVTREDLRVKYIVLTHAHYDHAQGLLDYKKAFPGALVAAHADEAELMNDPEANVSLYVGRPACYGEADIALEDGSVLTLGEAKYEIIHTPGHTPGSICIYSADEGLMFTGDTLFEGSRGRCDFKYGSIEDMRSSLERLFAMDGATVCLSGHGQKTLIGIERERVRA